MSPKRSFFDAKFSEQWTKSYRQLQVQEKKGTDKVIIALISDDPTPGMRVKPIEPDKYYNEARCTDGDRVIYRVENGAILFHDIVPHDLIRKYGREPK